MEFVLFKSNAGSVNTFISLGDETINSSLVERGRSLMDPQTHPSCTSSFEWNRHPRMSSFISSRNVEVTRGKIWAAGRILKCLPAKSLNLIPHQIGRALSYKRMISSDSIPGRFDYGASQHPQPPRNEPHLSDFLCLPPFPMLEEHTWHYAHLQNNKETTVWTCAFSLYMSPTLQMTISIRKNNVASFCEECFLRRVFSLHLTDL